MCIRQHWDCGHANYGSTSVFNNGHSSMTVIHDCYTTDHVDCIAQEMSLVPSKIKGFML